MKKSIKNLADFEKRFSTEKKCRDYLFDFRWTDGFRCPHCNEDDEVDLYWLTKNGLFRCKGCSRRMSVKHDTLFAGMKIPLPLILKGIWFIISNDKRVSARELQKRLRLKSYDSAWNLMHKIRSIMIYDGTPLSGRIEMTHAVLGKDRKSDDDNDLVIVVAVQGNEVINREVNLNDIKQIRIILMNNRLHGHSNVLIPMNSILNKNIKFELSDNGSKQPYITTIYTDAVNRFIKNIRERGGQGINCDRKNLKLANIVIADFKKYMTDIYKNAVSADYLQDYINEYIFKMNNRHNTEKWELFEQVVKNAMTTKAVSKQKNRLKTT